MRVLEICLSLWLVLSVGIGLLWARAFRIHQHLRPLRVRPDDGTTAPKDLAG